MPEKGIIEGVRFLLVILLALVLAPSSGAVQQKARIWLVSERPVVVRGNGFGAWESVRVSVAAKGMRVSKAVFASRSGVFVARWTRSITAGCTSVTVTAKGSRGTSATWRLVANDCGPNDPRQ